LRASRLAAISSLLLIVADVAILVLLLSLHTQSYSVHVAFFALTIKYLVIASRHVKNADSRQKFH
jgi:membrane protein YdbS with pleckstrin-like domain